MLNTLLHINKDGLQVVVVEMAGVENLLPQMFYSKQEREEFELLKSEKRQRERASTLFLLHDFLGIKSALHHHTNGCPYLEGISNHISISHTQHEIAIAIHASQKVGVDIENTSRNFARVAQRFLSTKEQNYLNTQTLQCLSWCAKETVFKLADEQGVEFADQIVLEQFYEQEEGEISAQFTGKGKVQQYLLHFHLVDNVGITYGVG